MIISVNEKWKNFTKIWTMMNVKGLFAIGGFCKGGLLIVCGIGWNPLVGWCDKVHQKDVVPDVSDSNGKKLGKITGVTNSDIV